MRSQLVSESFYQPKESDFELTSIKSWVVVVAQILKLFYFIRISKKSLKSTLEGTQL